MLSTDIRPLTAKRNGRLRSCRIFAAGLVLGVLGSAPAFAEKFDTIHKFAGDTRGEEPQGKLVAGSDGTLYGTTYYGGASNNGTVFRLKPNAAGTSWSFRVIYQFGGGGDGAHPIGALAVDGDGVLYGVTNAGGNNGCGSGCGTVFQLRPKSGGEWDKDVLHIFRSARDGSLPQGGVVLRGRALYGTAPSAGPEGNGTVFRLVRRSTFDWRFAVLYAFKGGKDGFQPEEVPTFFEGDLYGTTAKGGRFSGECSQNSDGCGTVFRLRQPNSGDTPWNKTTIYRFEGGPGDGMEPAGALAVKDDRFYGVTRDGGSESCGTVFRLNPKAAGSEAVIHDFTCRKDGNNPVEVGVLGERLIGVTLLGGSGLNGPNAGTVFSLKQSGGTWERTTIHAFAGGEDGGIPQTGVLITKSGKAYGTTYEGGDGFGTVFELFGPN